MKRILLMAAAAALAASVFADDEEEDAKPAGKKGAKPAAAEKQAAAKPAAAEVTEPKWRNLDEKHHFGGRQASAGYLRGKVVLVDCCDYTKPECVDRVKILKDIWNAYKTKQFVIIGSHRGKHLPVKVARVCDGLGITYPVYEDAGVPDDRKDGESFFYLIDANGKIRTCANELGKVQATVGSTIMAARVPSSVKKWREVLDYEVRYLPGRAYNHLKDFRKKHPLDADEYAAFEEKAAESKEIRDLAALEEYAREAKDCDYGDRKAKKPSVGKLEGVLKKYSKLKDSEDPIVVQEAKNCLAEITWAIAALKSAK